MNLTMFMADFLLVDALILNHKALEGKGSAACLIFACRNSFYRMAILQDKGCAGISRLWQFVTVCYSWLSGGARLVRHRV
jgi:hypothetical protein